uniref:Secreted protein n=1 Tax=Knipowitschia caucasica TaxID=637954 RepID=A0AAV2MBL1_KNICA
MFYEVDRRIVLPPLLPGVRVVVVAYAWLCLCLLNESQMLTTSPAPQTSGRVVISARWRLVATRLAERKVATVTLCWV